MKRLLTAAFFCLLHPLLLSAQVQKVQEPIQLWSGIEAEYQYSPKSLFYLDHQWRRVTGSTSGNISEKGVFSYFEDIRATAGYERLILKNTFLGLSQRISFEQNEVKWYSRFWKIYEKEFGNFEIENRVLYEHIRAKDTSEDPEKIAPENRIRGNIGLSRKFTLFTKQFEFSTEAEALFELRPPAAGISARIVDRTRLEAALSYQFGKHWQFSVFGIRQTNYGYGLLEDLPVTGPGNEIKVNSIRPVFGIELQFSGGISTMEDIDAGPGN